VNVQYAQAGFGPVNSQGGVPIMRSSLRQFVVPRYRIPTVFAAVLGVSVSLLLGAQAGAAVAATFTWSQGIEVPVAAPANAAGKPEAIFDWGACPTVESCAGVGTYLDEHGNREAMAATRTDGSWGARTEIALPPGAATSGQLAGFGLGAATVACTGADTCVAVGRYIDESGAQEAMVVSDTNGVWGPASEIKPPANAAGNPDASFFSLACPMAGSCVAVGEYHDENGHWAAMVAEEVGGSWTQASEVAPPANAASGPEARLSQVACSQAGSCVAIGRYSNSSLQREALVVTQTGGIWGQASQITLPANAGSAPVASFDSLVCVVSGPCTAVGQYTDVSGNEQAMVAQETAGSWAQASELSPPANAAPNPEISFGLASYAIACPGSGSCVITAKYRDSSGDSQAMVAQETGGAWAQASELSLPANAASDPEATVYPACGAPGSCVLAGTYTDEDAARQAMVAEEIGGSWNQASEAAPPANAEADPGVLIGEVQCPALGVCVSFGQYRNNTGTTQDMEVVGMTALEGIAAPIVSGTAEPGHALTCSQGIWTGGPTAYAYEWLRDGKAIGDTSSVYTVTAADEGHNFSCKVTATNASATRSAVSANSVTIHKEAIPNGEPEMLAPNKHQEEETLIAKRHQEEAEALARKRQEEERAKNAISASVSLVGSVIDLQSSGKGSLKLACAGSAPTCAGKLTLTAKGNHGKKAKAKTIATAVFSIPAGKRSVVTITLTASGRALLKANHGKLRASLTILESSPSPASTERKSVLLVQKKAAKARKPRLSQS
jgi:hypothetical protein